MPRNFDCGRNIFDIKFSSDGYYLAAAAEDSYVYIFVNTNNSYFTYPPKKLHFENECVVSLGFNDDDKAILVTTSHRNVYKSNFKIIKFLM